MRLDTVQEVPRGGFVCALSISFYSGGNPLSFIDHPYSLFRGITPEKK
jgi:hypothetical protein